MNLINIVVKQRQVENFICERGESELEEDSIFNIWEKFGEVAFLSNHLYLHRITQHRTSTRRQHERLLNFEISFVLETYGNPGVGPTAE